MVVDILLMQLNTHINIKLIVYTTTPKEGTIVRTKGIFTYNATM
jgi:hypothetical protein